MTRTPYPVTDQSEETMTLKGHARRTDEYSTETFPKTPSLQKREKSLKAKDAACTRRLSIWGAVCTIPFFSPTSFPTGMCFLNSKAVGSWQLVSG